MTKYDYKFKGTIYLKSVESMTVNQAEKIVKQLLRNAFYEGKIDLRIKK